MISTHTQKSEKHVSREQQLHVQLGYKNGLDGMSHIHSDKKNHLKKTRLAPGGRSTKRS